MVTSTYVLFTQLRFHYTRIASSAAKILQLSEAICYVPLKIKTSNTFSVYAPEKSRLSICRIGYKYIGCEMPNYHFKYAYQLLFSPED